MSVQRLPLFPETYYYVGRYGGPVQGLLDLTADVQIFACSVLTGHSTQDQLSRTEEAGRWNQIGILSINLNEFVDYVGRLEELSRNRSRPGIWAVNLSRSGNWPGWAGSQCFRRAVPSPGPKEDSHKTISGWPAETSECASLE